LNDTRPDVPITAARGVIVIESNLFDSPLVLLHEMESETSNKSAHLTRTTTAYL